MISRPHSNSHLCVLFAAGNCWSFQWVSDLSSVESRPIVLWKISQVPPDPIDLLAWTFFQRSPTYYQEDSSQGFAQASRLQSPSGDGSSPRETNVSDCYTGRWRDDSADSFLKFSCKSFLQLQWYWSIPTAKYSYHWVLLWRRCSLG